MRDGGASADAGVSVVVCCRDRAGLLAGALDAVRRSLRPEDELVVVDSASRDDAVAEVAVAAGARVVRVGAPGVGLARNAGWRAATRPLVVYTDDDCRPADGWVAAAARALADDRVGAVWGVVVGAGAGRGGVLLSTTDASTAAGVEPLEGTLDSDLTAIAHGATMAFRRRVLHQLGGFDEVFGGTAVPAGEDKDVFWRVMRAGWRVRLAPDMVVAHLQWRGRRAALAQMFRYGVGAGAVVAKRRRLDGDRGLLGRELWRHGAVPTLRAARRLEPVRAAGSACRTAGVVVGLARARRLDLTNGHFSPRAAPR